VRGHFRDQRNTLSLVSLESGGTSSWGALEPSNGPLEPSNGALNASNGALDTSNRAMDTSTGTLEPSFDAADGCNALLSEPLEEVSGAALPNRK
jgi:hypothetical protein